MKVKVRAYFNTGFNLLDRPSRQCLDNLMNRADQVGTLYYDIDDVYVVQNKGLDSIVLNMEYATARLIDYLRLTSTNPIFSNKGSETDFEEIYYVINGDPKMLNENTAEFSIKEDYITTYSINKDDFTSGQINVAHVPSDTWEWSNIPETRFQPSGILDLDYKEVESSDIKASTSQGDKVTLIASSCGITQTASSTDALISTAWTPVQTTLTGVDMGNIAVAIPQVKNGVIETSFYNYKVGSTDMVRYFSPLNIYKYTFGNETALNILRSLGLYDSIQAFYDIDAAYVDELDTGENPEDGIRVKYKSDGTKVEETFQMQPVHSIKPIVSKIDFLDEPVFNFEYTKGSYTPHNKKCFCGENNAYTILSKCTGNSMSMSPEDCAEFDNYAIKGTYPHLKVTADLRAGGAPKMFSDFLYKASNIAMIGINGMNWGNHQHNYFGQYGADVVNNQYKFNTFENTRDYARNIMSGVANTMKSGVSLATQVGSIYAGGNLMNAGVPYYGGSTVGKTFSNTMDALNTGMHNSDTAGKLLGSGGGVVSSLYDMVTKSNDLNYAYAQNNLAQELATGSTKSPVIEFPYSESSRDIFGNFFTVYRTSYTENQLKQLDAFFDLWGYQVGGIDITSDSRDFLSNRTYFNYISMTNVSLKKNTEKLNKLSMNDRMGIAADLGSVRIWKTLPQLWSPSMGNPIITIEEV